MDRRTTLQDIVVDAPLIVNRAQTYKSSWFIDGTDSNKEIESSEYLQALVSTCKSASQQKKTR